MTERRLVELTPEEISHLTAQSPGFRERWDRAITVEEADAVCRSSVHGPGADKLRAFIEEDR